MTTLGPRPELPAAKPASSDTDQSADRRPSGGAAHPAAHNNRPRHFPTSPSSANLGSVYGALDLGTNNCRLLLARPSRRGFRVVDAFSRIIRLGEGLGQSGQLSDAAMGRTMDALKVCAGKLQRHGVSRARMVAT